MRSSKFNPCPVCARVKDSDCSWTSDDEVCLCHTKGKDPQSVPDQVDDFHFTGKIKDNGFGLDVAVYINKKDVKLIDHIPGSKKTITPIKKMQNTEKITQVDLVKIDLPLVVEESLTPYLQKTFGKSLYGKNITTVLKYQYSNTQFVYRLEYEEGGERKKTFRQVHLNDDGQIIPTKGDLPWPAYLLKAIADHIYVRDYLLAAEGEGCVEAILKLKLACTTLQGSNWNPQGLIDSGLLSTLLEKESGLIYFVDNDEEGRKKGKFLKTQCTQKGLKCHLINMRDIGWADAPDKADIKDFLNNHPEMTGDDLAALLLQVISRKQEEIVIDSILDSYNTASENNQIDSVPDTYTPISEITQRVCHDLYSDSPWIYVYGNLYQWVGTHYELRKTVIEEKRIRDYLNNFSVEKDDKVRYPFANPASVKKCLDWVKLTYGVPSEQINPPGVNCLNGIVRIKWIGRRPSWELIPHSPDQYYNYAPTFNYNPKADPTDCQRLLEALEPKERTIFLKTVAASLDLLTVRKYWGRLIRALLCQGEGSNGKDAIRECVSLLHGNAMTAVTLSDFRSYDEGRKFPLARLVSSRFNWSSENIHYGKLDQLQSLKAAITGDKLSCEPKNKDEEEFIPKCPFIFNCNEPPKVQGHQEAFNSRYAILRFLKTFKINANTAAGELEADPRFKYDPDFLNTNVMPAFLNMVLEALVSLMADGIDYSCTAQAMEQIRAESNHLYQACKDLGLVAAKGEEIPIAEVYKPLLDWYVQQGYVEKEENDKGKVKLVWNSDIDNRDKPIKASNRLAAALKTVFGNGIKTKQGHARTTYLVGVKFNFSPENQKDPEISIDLHQKPLEPAPINDSSHQIDLHHHLHHNTDHQQVEPLQVNEHSLVNQNEIDIHHDVHPQPVEGRLDKLIEPYPEVGDTVEVLDGFTNINGYFVENVYTQYVGKQLKVVSKRQDYTALFLMCEDSEGIKTEIPAEFLKTVA